jgi:hypothetical protein
VAPGQEVTVRFRLSGQLPPGSSLRVHRQPTAAADSTTVRVNGAVLREGDQDVPLVLTLPNRG